MKKVFTFLIFSFLTSRIFAQGYGNFPYAQTFTSGSQPAEITVPSNSNPVSFTTNGMFLTPNQTQYFGAAYFNNIKFSSPQGIKIEFEYGMYGSTSLTNGADGLSVFLFDASVTDPQVGADGEALAYTYQRATQTYSSERRKGLSGAYLGIGLDAWGAFHERTFTPEGDRRKSGLGAKLTNNKSQVTLRGAEGKTNLDNVGRQAGYNGYPLLITKSTRSGSGSGAILNNDGTFTTTTGTTDNFYLNTLAFGNSPTDVNYRKAFIELLPNPAGGYNVTVKIQHGSAITTIIDNYHYKTSVTYIENANNALYEMGASYINDYIPTANSIPGNNSTHTLDTSVPQYFRIGFGASTGNGMNNHVIRNLKVTLPYSAVANDDSFTVDCNTKTFNVLTNDLAYDNISNPTASNVNIDKTSFRFIDVSGNPQGHSYTEAGKGTWTYNPTTGIVTFTPLSSYTSGIAQIRYDIKGIESPFNEEAYRSVPATITATVATNNCSPTCDKLYLISENRSAIYDISSFSGGSLTSTSSNKVLDVPSNANSTLAVGMDPNGSGENIFLTTGASSGYVYVNAVATNVNSNVYGGATSNPLNGYVYTVGGGATNPRRLYQIYPSYENLGTITGDSFFSSSSTYISTDSFFDNKGNYYLIAFSLETSNSPYTSNTKKLYRIDVNTRTATLVRDITGIPNTVIAVQGLAFYNNKIYMLYQASTSTNGNIYEIDPDTGVGTLKTTYVFPAGGNVDLGSCQVYNLPCNAGTTAPIVNTSVSNTCPLTTVNLNSQAFTGSMPTSPLLLEWWTTPTRDAGTQVTDPTAVEAGIYYAFYYDSSNNCWSPASNAVSVTINTCPTFDCETAGMFFSYGSTSNVTLHRVDKASNPFDYPALGSAAGYAYNAIGFNPVDGFLYAIPYNSNNLIRIDANGTYTDLGAVAGLPSGTYVAGEIDNLGNYYVKVGSAASNVMYKIDIPSRTATAITLDKTFLAGDFAFNPIDGLLYGVQTTPAAGAGKLLSINPATGAVNVIGSSNSPNNFTAMFGSSTGETFGIGISGGFYQFNLITGERVLIANSPAGSAADGAHCVNSTIKFNTDLYVTKTDNKTYYIPGATTTYTVVVGNNGPFGSMGAKVSDPVPTGIPAANVSYTATVSGGATTTVTGTQTGAINDVVDLPVGGKVTYTVTVTVPLDYTGDLINTVTVTPPSNTTDSDMSNNSVTDIDTAACFKPAVTSGTALATNHGITALGRAGADNPDNWPMVRKGAWTVLEAKTKGFVPNRLTDAQMTAIPAANLVEGMMIYNITQQCLMINTDGTATGWKCYGTPACPD